jgi:hypothetical protein
MTVYVKNDWAATQFEKIKERFISPLRQGFQPNRRKIMFRLLNAIDKLIV